MYKKERELYLKWLFKDITEQDSEAAFYAGYHSRDEEIKQLHKDYGYELQDPNGTIWDYCQSLRDKHEETKKVLIEVRKFFNRLPEEWYPESLTGLVEAVLED